MGINFNEEECILVFDGVEIRICEEKAIEIAKRILDYFEEEIPEED